MDKQNDDLNHIFMHVSSYSFVASKPKAFGVIYNNHISLHRMYFIFTKLWFGKPLICKFII